MPTRFSCTQLFATLWTVAHQAPLSVGFSRQEYWSRLPLPSPEDLLTQLLNPGLPHCLYILIFYLYCIIYISICIYGKPCTFNNVFHPDSTLYFLFYLSFLLKIFNIKKTAHPLHVFNVFTYLRALPIYS